MLINFAKHLLDINLWLNQLYIADVELFRIIFQCPSVNYEFVFKFARENGKILYKENSGVFQIIVEKGKNMCLILFAYKVHSQYPLIVVANRDEFFNRKTASVHYWEDEPEILAGRDLEKMGTWMGVTKNGRFAALTNYRDPSEDVSGKRSMGELVAKALIDKESIVDYVKTVQSEADKYPGFNLIVGDKDSLYYFSNKEGKIRKLVPGIYGLSNHLLNTPWPKVEVGMERLRQLIEKDAIKPIENLFTLLLNTETYSDDRLPKTGVPIEMERMLSPLFIKSANYGTRSSTVMLMSKNQVQYVEKIYQPERKKAKQFQFYYGK